MNIRQIILDTETTGLYVDNGDRLIEFAGLEMINRRFTANNLHYYIHPERDISDDAVAIHGITLKDLEDRNAPVFAKVAHQIADFLRGAELVIHNAKFDTGFLDMEFNRVGLPTVEELGCKIIDTLAMAREMFPGQKVSLDALCSRFSIDRSKRVFHGALIDCELLGEVYLAMTRGQFDLMVDGGSKDITNSHAAVKIQYSQQLKVLAADETELAEHEAYLNELDKVVGGRCLWRRTGADG